MKGMTIVLFLTALLSAHTYASERYYVSFDLLQNGKVLERGNDYVTKRLSVWNGGHTHSYLKLRCEQDKSGRPVKMFSTVGHFDGVRLTHRLIGDQIEVNVLWSKVKNRRIEIHNLGKKECADLSPIVTTITQSYTYPARTGPGDSRAFGNGMTFRFTVESSGSKRVFID
ncbi:MAG TPA: hypothetical protein DCF62_10145 [Porticoccaceae bacterium]|nr:hypothetical protein [Porticoccaceae bacterium]HCO58829.1 hypothetical protein [Porticoccaceae bacterium]